MTICPDFGLPARIWFSLPGFYFPSPDLTLAIHILPSLPAVDSTCWKCTLPAQIWVFLLRFHYSARIWLSLPYFESICRMYFSLQDFNIFARIWLFILGYDYLPWFWSPSTNLIFASWVLLSLPWFDSRYPYFTLFTRSWLHLLEVYSSCPNLSLSAEISLFCSDLNPLSQDFNIFAGFDCLFWIHFRFLGFTFPPLIWLSLSIFYTRSDSTSGSVLFQIWAFLLRFYSARIFLLPDLTDCLYSDMTICPDFGLPARIWFSLPGFYFPSPDLTLAIHILPSLPAVDSTCWKCTLPAQIWAFLLRFHYSARIWLSLPYFESICRMYFSLQDFNIFARIWLFILGYDYLPWFWCPSTNLIFASWVLLSLPWFDSRYPYFTLFTRSWLHLLEVYSSCPNLSLSAEISLFCSDLTLPALFWIHLPDVFLPSRF